MILSAAPLFAIATSGNAASGKQSGKNTTPVQERDAAEAYFSKKAPKLTAQEKAALAIAQKWQAASATGMKPVAGNDGMVRFVYGTQQISVVCAVLKACDIELQPGEQVNNLNGGDPRFIVEPAVSGSGATEVQHLILKPQDVGLNTNLIVTTNRRSYHINLRSHRTEFMARVGFIYPEDALAKWDAVKMREAKLMQEQIIPETKESIANLSFAYDIKGKAPWKPVRVYNDGVRTIIQMPAAMAETEAPILRVVLKDGGLFSDDVMAQVNYRIHEDRYIVDAVFHKGILSAGVGRDQQSVTIIREK
ncbi:P-type conjugative transfer protein TrbG [Massilia sp. R798]|uniref:P-type conjugative transfer protein TrbG n=2 Tax=Massilia soli TaxID=2792854 RepID=A0ABS7SK61_9BURK|nr:P-type conjugative transfer protein TrbG [Massilia soli]